MVIVYGNSCDVVLGQLGTDKAHYLQLLFIRLNTYTNPTFTYDHLATSLHGADDGT